MTTEVYIAAPFGHRATARAVANKLMASGFWIASGWLYPRDDIPDEDGIPGLQGNGTPPNGALCARRDLEDLLGASHLLQLNYPGAVGAHIEFGFALAHEIPCHLIGRPTTVFHQLEGVTVHSTVDDFIAAIRPQ